MKDPFEGRTENDLIDDSLLLDEECEKCEFCGTKDLPCFCEVES